jgi:hypothetical protein
VSLSFSFRHLGPFLGAQSLISDGSVCVRQVSIVCSAARWMWDAFNCPNGR